MILRCHPFLMRCLFSLMVVVLPDCSLIQGPPHKPIRQVSRFPPKSLYNPGKIRSRILSLMSSGNYREALAVSKTLHPGPDRENIERIIHREWGFDRRQRIGSDLLSGKETEALRILQNIQEKDPSEYRNILVELDPDQRGRFYTALIQDGQERQAIRTIDTLYADRKTAYDPILSFAYSHWAVRRLEEKRYRNALYFARKSRRADPHNRTARKVILRVSRMRDRLVNRGLLAYRHQQVQKAIDLWNRALLFDPSNPDIKRYILEARSILEKISVLKKSPEGPHP